MESVPHKSCTRCRQIKPLTEYQKRASSPDGHAWHCKACQRAYDQERKEAKAQRARERYAADSNYREKMKERVRRTYATDEKYREATKARVSAWGKANPDRVNANTRRRYHAGYKFRERELKSNERYWQQKREAEKRRMQDPEKYARARHSIKLAKYRRRALLEKAGTHTREEWIALCSYYGNKCLCCGRSDVPLEEDHIVPLSRHGTNTIDNIQCLCKPCNVRKMQRIIDYRPDKGAHLYGQERLF